MWDIHLIFSDFCVVQWNTMFGLVCYVLFVTSFETEWFLPNCTLFEGNVSPSSALSLRIISLALPAPASVLPVQVDGVAVVNNVSVPISKCNDRMSRASIITAFTEYRMCGMLLCLYCLLLHHEHCHLILCLGRWPETSPNRGNCLESR